MFDGAFVRRRICQKRLVSNDQGETLVFLGPGDSRLGNRCIRLAEQALRSRSVARREMAKMTKDGLHTTIMPESLKVE
jgi:hypothetical protein